MRHHPFPAIPALCRCDTLPTAYGKPIHQSVGQRHGEQDYCVGVPELGTGTETSPWGNSSGMPHGAERRHLPPTDPAHAPDPQRHAILHISFSHALPKFQPCATWTTQERPPRRENLNPDYRAKKPGRSSRSFSHALPKLQPCVTWTTQEHPPRRENLNQDYSIRKPGRSSRSCSHA